MSGSALRGIFIGTQSLLIRCAERFGDQGHDLRAIVSADPGVQRWSTERGVTCLTPGRDLAERLAQEPFDYLFSIAHLSPMPPEVLALPRRAAINFHDGPLPEYAGLNVTSWALLNNEREHGVTWHLMTERVDEGPILVERRFPIAEDDTALTLNAKCHDAGITSFEELLRGLSRGELASRRQDLRRRRYCAKHQRPRNAGSIDWSAPAAEIHALVRALDFGPYPNPLTTAKIWLGTHPVVVRRAEVLASRSRSAAGTVTRIASAGITVATGTQGVRLSGFTTLLGTPLATHDLEEAYGLREGDPLWRPSGSSGRALTELHARSCRHEEFWASRFRHLEPIDVPFARRRERGASEARWAEKELATPARFLDRFDPAPGDVLLASLAAYLSRIGGKAEFDVRFRHPELEGIAAGGLGLLSPHVPLHARVDAGDELDAFADRFLEELRSVREHGSYDLDIATRQPAIAASVRRWHEEVPTVELRRVGSLPASPPSPSDADWIVVVPDDARAILWRHREDVLDTVTVSRMEGEFRAFLGDLLQRGRRIQDARILAPEEEAWVRAYSSGPDIPYEYDRCVHELFEAQVTRDPEAAALVFRDDVLSYATLNARANDVAHRLIGQGIGPGALVGVLTERSPAMIAAMMGVLKAGAAYVPLDPTYPKERLAYMAQDARLAAVLCDESHASLFPGAPFPLIATGDIDLARAASANPVTAVRPHDLAYVIYTSGSTGKPKGVMIEHRNVASFFAAMDARLGRDPAGTWLAVTSISFDISVLEIFWTLARGFQVVLHAGDDAGAEAAASAPVQARTAQPLGFSLFYFASDEAEKRQDKYELLLEGARFADRHGFEAVWTPERHFHAFGGLYPNPSVVSAAIAAVTERVKIRAGSCVLPLHSPLRVAEEWALVDNLSNGRVGISFASGWQPDDFAIAPDRYQTRHQEFYRGIDLVRALWRGERRMFRGPSGEVEVRTLPRPVQPELPCWVTAAGNPETFRQAGAIGANLLTHLLGQSMDELADKLETYRQARRDAGHPGHGRVTLMLHAFVAADESFVRSQVRRPMKEYLRSATNLLKQHASSFPAFRRAGREGIDRVFQELSPADMDALLEHAFTRYYETSGLFGTVERCLAMVDALRRIGVDEIACLVDFGVPSDVVLAHLPYLDEVRQRASTVHERRLADGHALPALLARHSVTHLQCTPTLARILTTNEEARAGLCNLGTLMVGGEAFPSELGVRLRALVPGRLLNMYGPTETTIWSATHDVTDASGTIPIGRPIANTQIYVVDANLQLVPPGVAGEIVIGGDGVSRGYLDRPEITAERFVPDPFRPSGRLYRTGDQGRWREDGVLEFLGRMDSQVKIRGHRVELGEIQAVLNRHPAVHASVVAAREDTPGEKRLVGYVIPERGRAPTPQDLRDHLRRELPDFMIPAAFVMLEAFPLTPNKKVDVRNLPAPDATRPELEGAYVAPRTPNEAALAGFFQEALGLERVGVHDDFIQLGGDSLSAVEIFSRIQEAFRVEFPLAVLFRTPTVAGLAEEIERALARRPAAPAASSSGPSPDASNQS